MSTFALDLANRLRTNENFRTLLGRLQCAAIARTLPQSFEQVSPGPSETELLDLLYCASVFVQTDIEAIHSVAQTIALSALLLSPGPAVNERCVALLADLGNFPSLDYAEKNFGLAAESLKGMLRLRVSRALNTIMVGTLTCALTDYQKQVWDNLQHSDALAISAPTSAGKSHIIIEYLCRAASSSPAFRAVYLAPTRALLSEVHHKLQERLGRNHEIRISSSPTFEASPREIYVLTQERLQVLLTRHQPPIDMLVVDEAQNFREDARGMILQECLEVAVRANAHMKVLLLAPGATGFEKLASITGIRNLNVIQTSVSPVLQNRIVVRRTRSGRGLSLFLLTDSASPPPIGTLSTDRGFEEPASRLAAVALELGKSGGSLVYASGPVQAEKVARQILHGLQQADNPHLTELAEFITQHIHPTYPLIDLVRRGVAFHYGHMPAPLREAIESAFKDGHLKFLVCTTTLFQGINLPARNVFIGTPTRGRGNLLEPALLWNFAGRAGRLARDVIGNVFLVEYDDWDTRPMDTFVGIEIESASSKTLEEHHARVMEALRGGMPKANPNDPAVRCIRACAGLLVAKAATGEVSRFLARTMPHQPELTRKQLETASVSACEALGLPTAILASNWTVDPFGQRRLYDKIMEKICEGNLTDVIPMSPLESDSMKRYAGLFSRIQSAVFGQGNKYAAVAGGLAVQWMSGAPYPVILAREIRRAQDSVTKATQAYEAGALGKTGKRVRRPAAVDPSRVIRDTFKLLEKAVRFEFVQLGKLYIDLLTYALGIQGHEELVPTIYDFPLALELGVATGTARAFVELGFSRISATELSRLVPNSRFTVEQASAWVRRVDLSEVQASRHVLSEIVRMRSLMLAS